MPGSEGGARKPTGESRQGAGRQPYCYEDFALLAKILGPKLIDVERKRIEETLFEPARRAELFDTLLGAFPEVSTSNEAVVGADDDDEPEEPPV
jgi:hypothetical protein